MTSQLASPSNSVLAGVRRNKGTQSWYKTMQQALDELGFKRTEVDHTVFLKMWKNGKRVILAILVDDCLEK